jgi:hypothetical protein
MYNFKFSVQAMYKARLLVKHPNVCAFVWTDLKKQFLEPPTRHRFTVKMTKTPDIKTPPLSQPTVRMAQLPGHKRHNAPMTLITLPTPTMESVIVLFAVERNAKSSKVISKKMHGNVFHLYEESRKANQFTTTLKALKRYATLEFEHPLDLAPFFANPISNPVILEPMDLPPKLRDKEGKIVYDANGKPVQVPKESRQYITWQSACENYDIHVQALKTNKTKLLTAILSQCSKSVKPKLEATTGYGRCLCRQ